MSVKVVNKLPVFSKLSKVALSQALSETARDILIDAKNHAPYQKGGLRRSSDTHMVAPMKHRVSFWVEYARFQEFGGDGRRTVRNYTTSGTGKGYLKGAGERAVKAFPLTLAKHAGRVRV